MNNDSYTCILLFFQLLKLLKTIMENREEMPCFDPREVMILTNQWDAIENDDSSSDEDEDGKSKKEDQHAETWKLIQRKFENAWCSFDVEKVFRVSLTQVYTFFSVNVQSLYDRSSAVTRPCFFLLHWSVGK